MTAEPSKFIFDLDMSVRRKKTRTLSEEELASLINVARREGFEDGHAKGEKGELARTAQAILTAAGDIAKKAEQITGAIDEINRKMLGESVHLGKAVGHKLATHLMAKEPAAELEALVTECMTSLDHVPHLVIHCHPDLADAIRETTEQAMTTSGFSGRLIVMGDPEIPISDGRIEWADGGLVRDTNAISDEIDKCIENYLNAKDLPATGETEQ